MINKIRVSELLPGDHFEMNGHEYKVREVVDGRVFFSAMVLNWNDCTYPEHRSQSLGARSQQFVNLVRDAHNRKNKTRVPADPEIIGPGASPKSDR